MFGAVAILFFSVTGFTLNHPDWFFSEQTRRITNQLDIALLNQNRLPPQDWDEVDYSHHVSYRIRFVITQLLISWVAQAASHAQPGGFGPSMDSQGKAERSPGKMNLVDLFSQLKLRRRHHCGRKGSLFEQ